MEQVTAKRTGSRWGAGIVVLWTGFALFSVALAIVASCQDFSLVEPDYYERGLAHQQRIDELRRTAALTRDVTVELRHERGELMVTFPPECATDTLRCDVLLYRPSNSHWDQHWADRVVRHGVLALPFERQIPGLWRLRIHWRWRNETYYSESRLLVPK